MLRVIKHSTAYINSIRFLSPSNAIFLILRYPIAKDLIVPYSVLVCSTAIIGVSLNSINDTVFDFLNNTCVV